MRPTRLIPVALALAALLPASVLPAQAAQPARLVTQVSFASPQVGWIKVSPNGTGTGRLFRTLDGGTHWTEVDPSIQAIALGMQDAVHGAALVFVPGSAGACQEQLTAVETADGGKSWHNPAQMHAENGPTAVAETGGRALVLNGSCAGAYGTLQGLGSSPGSFEILHRFALTQAQAQAYFNPSAVSLQFHGADGVAALAYLPVHSTSAPLVVIYASSTGGRNWREVSAISHGLGGTVHGMSFANDRDGIAAVTLPGGQRSALFETTDGGRVWTRTRTLAGSLTSYALDLVTGKVGYAAVSTQEGARVQSVLLKTLDGGRTWRPVGVPH